MSTEALCKPYGQPHVNGEPCPDCLVERHHIPDVLANAHWDEHAFANALASAVVYAINDAHAELRANGYRLRPAIGDPERYSIVPESVSLRYSVVPMRPGR